MKRLVVMFCGLLLLISAAAATGNDNEVSAVATIETSGTCIVGADVVQSSTLNSALLGCDNDVYQDMALASYDNSLIGLADEETGETGEGADMDNDTDDNDTDEAGETFMGMNFIQSGVMNANVNGSGSNEFQDVDIIAAENCQTVGNFTQFASQTANDFGCSNDIFQDSDVIAGAVECAPESGGNSLVMSDATQAQAIVASTTGSYNDVDQYVEQFLSDSCLTTSGLVQEAMAAETIVGCDNSNDIDEEEGQFILQIVDDTDFVGSRARQVVSENEQATGSDNLAAQFGETVLDDDCLTRSAAVQSISESFEATGCDNIADQDALLSNVDNSMVDGTLTQQATINTNA